MLSLTLSVLRDGNSSNVISSSLSICFHYNISFISVFVFKGTVCIKRCSKYDQLYIRCHIPILLNTKKKKKMNGKNFQNKN